MNWYMTVLKKYADFSGRARRMEYWMFMLINMLIYIGLATIAVTLGGSDPENPSMITTLIGLFIMVYGLAIFVPSLAVGVRRLHDSDKSGWLILVNLIPGIGGLIFLVLMVLPGTPGENQYGSDPLG
jgi:uncharacterized membrane protein YhaH (DUF805 family)